MRSRETLYRREVRTEMNSCGIGIGALWTQGVGVNYCVGNDLRSIQTTEDLFSLCTLQSNYRTH